MIFTKKRKAKFFKFLGLIKLPYLPFLLNIESGNICNLKCPLCPTGQDAPGMEKGFLELKLFKELFDQLKVSLGTINFYSWGEPLLNKDLILMLRYAKTQSPNLRIITSTNLNINNKDLLSDLITTGIDEIIVSCDGATPDSYIKYRIGGNFNLVMDNLRYLTLENKRLKKEVNIVWNFLVFRHNEHEITMAKEIAKKIEVNFRVGLMRTSMKDEVLISHQEAIKKDRDWIPDNPKYSAYDKVKDLPKKIIKTCRKPWQEISINWDGKVFPCCAVYGDNYNFGDAKKNSIKYIWNNEKYICARKEIFSKNKKTNTVCGICRNNGFMHM